MNHFEEHPRNKAQHLVHLGIGVQFLLREVHIICALVEHMDLVLAFHCQNVLDHVKQDAPALKVLLQAAKFDALRDITV